MEILIVIALLAGAVVFLLIELFLIPGISLAGILAGVCALYANYYAFSHLGAPAGLITLAVTIVGGVLAVRAFMRSKALDRLSLKQDLPAGVDRGAAARVRVGDRGLAVTRLALIGMASIGGEPVEVKSTDGFLDEKTPVVVVRITGGIILVARDREEKKEESAGREG